MKTLETYPKKLTQIRGGLVQPVIGQVILAILAGMTGDLAMLVFVGIIAHWALVAYIAARRHSAVTKADAFLIRFGYILFGGGVFVAILGAALIADVSS